MIWKGWITTIAAVVFIAMGTGCKTPLPEKPYVCKDDVILLGDTLTISFLDIPDAPAEKQYVVRADGTVNMFRLGSVPAAGKNFSTFEQEMKAAYIAKGFYNQMTVVVKPGDRFYTVAGEVNSHGLRMVYSGQTTVLRAIASAGDFTEYANRSKVEITRADGTREIVDGKQARKDARWDRAICPGDYIHVPAKSF